MRESMKNRILIGLLLTCIIAGGLMALLLPHAEISAFERRKLHTLPAPTMQNVFQGAYAKAFDAWLPDHFPFRDAFRSIAAFTRLNLIRERDSNGLYLEGDSIYKLEYPETPDSIEKTARVLNSVLDRFPEGAKLYLAVIPDKNAYAPGGRPRLDYESFISRIQAAVPDAKAITLSDCLSAESFYRTDIHWRQEALCMVVDRLSEDMDLPLRFADGAYHEICLPDFYGVLFGQLALPVRPDELRYLTNDSLDSLTAVHAETGKSAPVYSEEAFLNVDPYDVFLSGASALVEIENINAATDRELVLIRDSFGSSLAPLLINQYRKITLVDLRYLNSAYLDQFLDFKDQDVLILLSTLIWNGGGILK